MNNLEYIDKQILLVKQNIQYHKDLLITVDDDESIEIIKSAIKLIEPDLQTLQQIKSELEAWEVVKKHCDYQDGDRFNCIPEGFYIIEPIRGKDFLVVKKALEVEDE